MGPDPCHSQLFIIMARQPHRNAPFISVKNQDAVCSPSSLPWRSAEVYGVQTVWLWPSRYRRAGQKETYQGISTHVLRQIHLRG